MTVGEFGHYLSEWGHPPCPIGKACQKISKTMPDHSPEEQMATLMIIWSDEFDKQYWMNKLPSKANKYIKGALFE